MFDNIYANRKVLVTGHTGFKGAWLALWLRELGAEVAGYALEPPSSPSMFEVCGLGDKFNSIKGDVRDLAGLVAVFENLKPEMVFHLAAQSLVRPSYKDPVETYSTNVMGTVNVLEAARRSDFVKVVTVVTSDKCYKNIESPRGYRETDQLGGHDPYSSSKACAELVSHAYLSSYFSGAGAETSVCTARAGNVIGGGDWATDRLIPDCIRSLQKGEPVKVRNPKAVRPWQHVFEPLMGYLALGAGLFSGNNDLKGAWNFGPDAEDVLRVDELVARVVGLWGEGAWDDVSGPEGKSLHETGYLVLDSAKAKDKLNWKPCLTNTEAIEMTVRWYRHYHESPETILDFSIKQLNDFCGRLMR